MANIYDFFGVDRVSGSGVEVTSAARQPLFLEPKNLTFPGVTIVAGTLANFAAGGIPEWKPLIALVIAVVFGGFLIAIGLTDPQNRERKLIQWFVGVVNTALLWMAVWGVSSIQW